MNEIVRVGVVGTSGYMEGLHLLVLKSHPRAQITAICGRNQARAEELAGKYGIPRVFTDYRKMMSREVVDAVVIAVPDDMHYPINMAALEAGLHVQADKPFAMNLGQAREMLAKAEAARVKHMVFFTYRWVPWIQLMQKLVAEGWIGTCYDAQFEYYMSYAGKKNYQWKWDRAHGLAYTQANETASLLVQFANGATGAIFLSALADTGSRGQVQRVQLSGSGGTLEMVADSLGYSVRGLRRGDQDFQTIPVPAEFTAGSQPGLPVWDEVDQIFTHQSVGTRLFIDSILADRPIIPGFEQGVKVQAVIDAAFQADASGCWVDVEK